MSRLKMSGLTDFRRFFTSFVGLIGAGVATTALVLVIALVGIAPPWPVAIVQVTAIAQLVALIFVFQRLEKSGRTKIDTKMRNNLIFLIILALLYLTAHSLLVFAMPNGDLGVRGVFCSQNALRLFSDSCPFLERTQISTAEFEADRLWTPIGLAVSRIGLLVAWVGAFACLVNVVAAFVVFQRRQKTGK